MTLNSQVNPGPSRQSAARWRERPWKEHRRTPRPPDGAGPGAPRPERRRRSLPTPPAGAPRGGGTARGKSTAEPLDPVTERGPALLVQSGGGDPFQAGPAVLLGAA